MILVEDPALDRFACNALKELGFSKHEIRVLPYPVGGGSGKQWVSKQYAGCVKKELRSKSYQRVALVVGTDADELTVDRRAGQLADALQAAGLGSRGAEEPIIHWIPKWNVETWLLCLVGQACDENYDYKRDLRNPNYQQSAENFVTEYRQSKSGNPPTTLPSLATAYQETARLDV